MGFEEMDRAVTRGLNALSGHGAALDAAMRAITIYGAFAIVAAVAVRWWWSGQDRLRERHLAILCGLSAALGLVFNQAILLFVHRMRPYDAGLTHLLIAPSSDPSFPSDHATLSFAVALAMLGAGARRGWGFLLAAILIGLSRVYVGTHYVSDVAGGALTGAAAALICLALVQRESRLTRTLSAVL